MVYIIIIIVVDISIIIIIIITIIIVVNLVRNSTSAINPSYIVLNPSNYGEINLCVYSHA